MTTTANAISIQIGTHDDVVLAVGVTAKCKVLACRNPADAASPVLLHAGDYVTNKGQAATYSHHIDADLARTLEAGALVETYWDGERWTHTITPVDREIRLDPIVKIVKERVAAREWQANRERQEKEAAERKAQQEQTQTAMQAAPELVRAGFAALGITPYAGEMDVTSAGDRIVEIRVDEQAPMETARRLSVIPGKPTRLFRRRDGKLLAIEGVVSNGE